MVYMPEDVNSEIEKLRCDAIKRCKERIELSKTSCHTTKQCDFNDSESGITTNLKRKHGL